MCVAAGVLRIPFSVEKKFSRYHIQYKLPTNCVRDCMKTTQLRTRHPCTRPYPLTPQPTERSRADLHGAEAP